MISELAKALNDLNIEVIAPVTEHISVGGWRDGNDVIHTDFRQSHIASIDGVPALAQRILSTAGKRVQFGLCPAVPIGPAIETVGFFQSGNVRGRLLSEPTGLKRFDVVYRPAP